MFKSRRIDFRRSWQNRGISILRRKERRRERVILKNRRGKGTGGKKRGVGNREEEQFHTHDRWIRIRST